MAKQSFESYLPRLVREWARDRPGEGAREVEGTLVSVDISGFTRLSERLQAKGRAGAEELVLLISDVFQGLIGICERHGGDVLKFRGDALLLFFFGDGHERRACQAASHMQWLTGETGKTMSSVGSVTLRMSTGIYTGPCHFFLVDGRHKELLITGPGATATIRLESAASAGQILVSPRTAEALEPAWLGQAREGGRVLRKLDEDDVAAHFASVQQEAGDFEQFIPEPLRAQLVLEVGEAEHRQVTAAFLKFGGIDGLLKDNGADDVHARLNALAEIVQATIAELGLLWLESDIDVDGGKLYLVGGAPSSTGADEERMLRALRRFVEADVGLTLRAGVNRGPAFCGDVGAETRRTYAVMGDTVNLAARLSARADVGGILATADVLDRSRTRYESESQPFLVKGKERPITAYRVGAVLGTRRDEPTATLPLVGRETELAVLGEAVNAARMRQQRLVELIGEPGIGKSRLVDELKAQALGFTQLVAHCDQYASSTPYYVFRSLLRPLAGITDELSPAEAGAHLAPWIQAVMPDLAQWLPLLAIPFGAEVDPTPESEEIDAAFRREKLHEVVDQFLLRVLMMPTLIVVEDAHWADDASRELFVHVTSSPLPRPWLVCITRRPQSEPVARDLPSHRQLHLTPLTSEATQSLARAAAGDVALSRNALAALGERSGGNPLFVRELVAAARTGTEGDELPDSVETVILARMDTLPPEDRFLLRNASVLGAYFELDLLAEIIGNELEDVAELGRWERLSEFVAWEGAGALHFQHDLFRAVAYQGLSFRRRREVHGRVGRVLEERGAEPALLSLHYFRAHEHEKVWEYSVLAGRQAKERYANVDAVELYGRALEVAEEVAATPAQAAEVAEALGDVAEIAARYDDAASAYARARKLVEDDVITQTRLLQKEGVIRERLGRYPDALRSYGKALKALDGASDIPERDVLANRAELELAYGGVRFRQGQFGDAIEWTSRAAEHAEMSGNRTGLAHAYYLLHLAHSRLGDGNKSYRGLGLDIYEETGDLLGQTRVLNNLGVDAYYEGRWDDALDFYRRCGEIAERAGDVILSATSTNNIAEILCDRGQLDGARAEFEEALRVFRAAEYTMGAAIVTSNLGRVAARAGRFDAAHALLDAALAQLEALGAESLTLEVRAKIAECLVLEGRHKDATALLKPLLSGGSATQRAALERLMGYATVQNRAPFARAKPHFDASEAAAREADAQYELALTLRAVAETSRVGSPEADEILERLGVAKTPTVPLP